MENPIVVRGWNGGKEHSGQGWISERKAGETDHEILGVDRKGKKDAWFAGS